MLVLPCPAAGFNDRLCPLGQLFSTDAGRLNRAPFCYETALKLSPENANLPVRLAQAYIRQRQLHEGRVHPRQRHHRITPSPCSYVALSKTYIEQDKILDARSRCWTISASADVKAQIDALRPNAPCFQPKADTTANTLTSPSRLPRRHGLSRRQSGLLMTGMTPVAARGRCRHGRGKRLVSDAVYGGYTIGSVVEEVKLLRQRFGECASSWKIRVRYDYVR